MSLDISACGGYNKDDVGCPKRYECKRFEASFNKSPFQSWMETPEFGEDGCELRIQLQIGK